MQLRRIALLCVLPLVARAALAAFGPAYCPVTNAAYQCVYTDAFLKRPRMGGFMLPPDGGTEQDFRDLAKIGARLVRYQMKPAKELKAKPNASVDEYETAFMAWIDGRMAKLDQMIRWTDGTDIWFVVDLHGSPGGLYSADNLPKEAMTCKNSNRMFGEKVYAAMFLRAWRRIAEHCRDLPRIWGYDLVNEPNQTMPMKADFWTLQKLCAEHVRKFDPKTPIIIESNRHSIPYTYDDLAPLEMPDIVYSVHMYLPFDFTHQGVLGMTPVKSPVPYPNDVYGWDKAKLVDELKLARAFQQRHGAHIFVGEFGAAVWAPGREKWFDDVILLYREWGWDWTLHAFREWSGWSLEHTAAKWGVCEDSNFTHVAESAALNVVKRHLAEMNPDTHGFLHRVINWIKPQQKGTLQ